MIYPGLCTLTLGHLQPSEVIRVCNEAKLTHVEWWGKDHVPVGDVTTAKAVGQLTRDAGLAISTYGSYYRVGASEPQGLTFDDVLRTTIALGAPAVRVWAGNQGSDVCIVEKREAAVAETLRIADLCADAGITLVFEYHRGTLTDSNDSAVALAKDVQHPAVRFGWQARTGVSNAENMEGLQAILPWLGTLHVFNWTADATGKFVRHPLAETMDEWRGYVDLVNGTGRDHVALLEFVKDNTVEQFKEDAQALKELVCL
jgi:3-dehydroshikimate dehydratase